MLLEYHLTCHLSKRFFSSACVFLGETNIIDGKKININVPITGDNVKIIFNNVFDVLYKIYTSYEFVVDCGMFTNHIFQRVMDQYSSFNPKISPMEKFENIPAYIVFSCVVEYILCNDVNKPDYIYEIDCNKEMSKFLLFMMDRKKFSAYSIWTFTDSVLTYNNMEPILHSHLIKLANEYKINVPSEKPIDDILKNLQTFFSSRDIALVKYVIDLPCDEKDIKIHEKICNNISSQIQVLKVEYEKL